MFQFVDIFFKKIFEIKIRIFYVVLNKCVPLQIWHENGFSHKELHLSVLQMVFTLNEISINVPSNETSEKMPCYKFHMNTASPLRECNALVLLKCTFY